MGVSQSTEAAAGASDGAETASERMPVFAPYNSPGGGWGALRATGDALREQSIAVKEADFYTSGRTSNDAALLYQLFVRRLGTNNFPDCLNLCHEPTSVGLPESIGARTGTVVLDDFAHADAIFIVGQLHLQTVKAGEQHRRRAAMRP